MAYITFQPSDHFNTKIYTGTGSTNNITGIGFQPDLNWTNKRTSGNNHAMVDVVRGVTKTIYPDETYVEGTQSGGLTAFGTDGYTIGTSGDYNDSGVNYVSWNWRAANAQGSSNTDGSINTTYTSANTTAGFSISTYTGTGSNATVGHGLGVVPKMIIIKCLDQTHWWFTYHVGIGDNSHVTLNTNTAKSSNSAVYWNSTTPTASVFSIGTDTGVNQSGQDYVAYSFAPIKGYSKFGSYKGNGSADGIFIYTGFKPAFVMTKKVSASDSWIMLDNRRDAAPNPHKLALFADHNGAESGDYLTDFNSNGFKIRSATGSLNTSAADYIYMAFAEEPLVSSNNIPATAR